MLLCKVCWSLWDHSSRFDTLFVSVSRFAHIVLAKCVNFLLLVFFLQKQDWLCTHTTSIVLWQTAYRRHLFARALSLKRAQASYTRPNDIQFALSHITLRHTTLPGCQADFKSMPWRSRCGTHKLLASSNKSHGCSLVQEGWLTWVLGKKQQSLETKSPSTQALYDLFTTDKLQSHQQKWDAMLHGMLLCKVCWSN